MNKCYLLTHTYPFCDGMETKELGIYSTRENAKAAQARYFQLEGFREYPETCFSIRMFSFDADEYWKQGFVNATALAETFRTLTVIINEMADMNFSPEDAWNHDDYYYVLCEISAFVYHTNNKIELANYIQELFKDYMKTALSLDTCIQTAEQLLALSR